MPEIPEPGSEEWNEAVKRSVRQKQFDDAVAKAYEEANSDGISSWERIGLHEIVFGDLPEICPKVLLRGDGKALGYPGCTHSIHGPAGSGKTWLALLACAQRLDAGDDVLYLDYESFPLQIVKRLLALGVSHKAIDERLHYHRPEAAPDVLDVNRNAFAHLLSREYGVAVLDGANISMALCGLHPDSATDVALWHNKIILPIAEKTGAAVFACDHVPKHNSTNPSGFAIGSQHKIAGLTGAAFVMEKMVPFGRGLHGVATVRVAPEKDREGFVHGLGIDDGQPDGYLVGELHVDDSLRMCQVQLRNPTSEIIDAVADKRSKNKKEKENNLGYEMELISAYWENALTNSKSIPGERSQRKTIEALRASQDSKSVKFEKKLTKENLTLAIKALIDSATPGGPYAKVDETITLRGGGHPYENLKRYFRPDDNEVSEIESAGAAIAEQLSKAKAEKSASSDLGSAISVSIDGLSSTANISSNGLTPHAGRSSVADGSASETGEVGGTIEATK